MRFLLLITACLCWPVSFNDMIGKAVPHQYIVVFKEDAKINLHFDWLQKVMTPVMPMFSMQDDARVEDFVENKSFDFNWFGIMHKYSLPHFQGYSARLPFFIVELLKHLPEIETIEEDIVMGITTPVDADGEDPEGNQEKTPAWGLIRIANRELPERSDKTYSFPISAGTGVTAYVIDTGVRVSHPEFQGRARIGKSFSGDGTRDGNGHGTHVAGTIGSKTYGVAKNVSIVAVKVLDNRGSGTTSNVIAGIDWAAKDTKSKNGSGKRKSVANMSLGGGASAALDKAIKAAIKHGLVFAVAAGNSAGDACSLSPARVPEAITVAASDKYDKLASFSEKGKCVDIIAPGVDILSTWNNGRTNVISGTSMATPHVAGAVALALAEGNFDTVAEVHDYMKEVASKDKIEGRLKGAPNSLLYNKVSGGDFPDDEPREPLPVPEDPNEPDEPEGECPIPRCLFDPACTSCCVDC